MAYDLFNLRRFQKGSDDAVPMNASHPPDSQSTRRALSGSRFLAGVFGPPGGSFSSPNPPSNGATSLLSLNMGASRVLTGIAILAALCLSLLFMLNSGLVRAQSADQFFTYVENGTGPVATFTASDPEGATPGYWSLVQSESFTDIPVDGTDDIVAADVADENLFKIDQSGVLSFKEPPSYEDNSDSATTGTPASTDKEYRVTVQVSDGSEVEYFKAYVAVTDEEETGKITWTVDPDGADGSNGP